LKYRTEGLKDELMTAFLSYMPGQIEYDELDKKNEEIFF